MRRAGRLAAIAVVVVAALSGCVRITSNTDVHGDDTFSQVTVLALTDAARAQVEQMAGVKLDNLQGAITSSPQYKELVDEYPGQLEVADYADGDIKGVQITATDLPLDAFETAFSTVMSQLPLTANATLVRTDDTFVVSIPAGGAADLLDGSGISAGQVELLGSQVDVGLTFGFPGLVQSASAGTVDGNSVTVGLADLLGGEDIRIVASAEDQINWKKWLLWGGIALAVLVIVGGAAALIAQDVRRHRTNALPPPDAVLNDATGPGVLPVEKDAPPPDADQGEAPDRATGDEEPQ